MKSKATHTTLANDSPWLDTTKPNLFRREFRLIADTKIQPEILKGGGYFTPFEIYRWIYDHNGVDIFFKGLARFAPMFALEAYHGRVAIWTSPPTSGLGNAIYMVMGHDKNRQLRLVGGNYFSEAKQRTGSTQTGPEFFAHFEQADEREQFQLVKDTLEKSIQDKDETLLLDISRECEHFHTLAIYVAVLTDKGCLFHAGKAVIDGDNPSDTSFEFLGEIK